AHQSLRKTTQSTFSLRTSTLTRGQEGKVGQTSRTAYSLEALHQLRSTDRFHLLMSTCQIEHGFATVGLIASVANEMEQGIGRGRDAFTDGVERGWANGILHECQYVTGDRPQS